MCPINNNKTAIDANKKEGCTVYNNEITEVVSSDVSEDCNEDIEAYSNNKTKPAFDNQDNIPDGGYGWAIVVGSFFAHLICFGVITSWYVFVPVVHNF